MTERHRETSGYERSRSEITGFYAAQDATRNETREQEMDASVTRSIHVGYRADQSASRIQGVARRSTGTRGAVDKALIKKALAAIDAIEGGDHQEVVLQLAALRGIILDLWDNLISASSIHHGVLASIESLVLSQLDFTTAQIDAMREGFTDLQSDALSQSHIDVLQDRMLSVGHNPLTGLIDQTPEHDDVG